MHFTHTPIHPLSPPSITQPKHRINKRGLTRVLERVNKILQPLSPEHTSIIPVQELLTFKVTKECYLSQVISLITKSKLERTSLDLLLISGYFTYLPDFVAMIKRTYRDKAKDIIKQIADVMNYVQFDHNELIIRNGDENKLFYLILNGSVDILRTKRFQDTIMINEYYRYLALLIGYNEIDILNKVINDNKNIFGIEIADSNGYGKIDVYSSNYNPNYIYKQVTLAQLFKTLTRYEWQELNELGYVDINIRNGKVVTYNEWYDVNNPIRNGAGYNRSRHKKTQISTEEYINRLMRYKITSNVQTQQQQDKDKEVKTYTLNLYCYIHISRLLSGQYFGEFNANDVYNKRTFTAISNSPIHLGTFTLTDYTTLLREPIDKTKKLYMLFILSTYVFKGYSLGLLQTKYFNKFIILKSEKNAYPLIERTSLSQIYLFKEGTYESTITASLYYLGKIINTLFTKLKEYMQSVTTTNNNNTSIPLETIKTEVISIYEKVKHMRYENEKIHQTAKDIPLLKKFYFEKQTFKIYSTNTPELYGFTDLCMDGNVNIFSVKCVSKIGEYLVLNESVYSDMKGNDIDLRRLEKEYCYMKNYKTIKRLLDIRKIKIQTFIEHNKINNILNLKGYIDPYQHDYLSRQSHFNYKNTNINKTNSISSRKCSSLCSKNTNKTRISSPLLMQCFMQSVRNIKSSKPKHINKSTYINNSSSNSNTLLNSMSMTVKAISPTHVNNDNNNSNNNSKHYCTSLKLNCKSNPLLSHSSILSEHSNLNNNKHNKSSFKNYKHFLLQNDYMIHSPNNKVIQLTKYNLFKKFNKESKRKTQTGYYSFSSSTNCKKEKCVNVYQSSNCLVYNNKNGLSDRMGMNCVSAKKGSDNSSDVVFSSGNNSNSFEYVNVNGSGNSCEDYQLKKKRKYIENRKVYLMKNTRDFFLRYKDKLEMKKRKKK